MQRSRQQPKSEKELYREQYEESKRKGETFFPYTLARDALVGFIVVAVVIALAIWSPAKLEPMADPTSTTYNPRPEWYFLFFFQFLKLFPGWLEAVAAIIIPLLALTVLILIPFLDRSFERRWSKRKHWIAVGVVVVVAVASLGVLGAVTAPSRPAGEESLLVQEGRDVYQEINCSYCHSINGIGGNIGPDLGRVGEDLTEDQLIAYLQNPHAMVPKTLHPKLLFTGEELQALITYLSTLGAQVSYTEQAPELYKQYCSSCHAINGEGGTVGPDLTNVGDRRPLTFLEAYTRNPDSVLPNATMPAFEDKLSLEQIRDIAAYLYSQKSEVLQEPLGPSQVPSSPEQPEAPTSLAPPGIPHEIEGREDCLQCHDLTGIQPFPDDHVGRTSNICTTCHQPSLEEKEPREVEEKEEPPVIPHTLEGFSDCLQCHSESGIKPFPADHSGRTNDICTACHQQSK